MEFYKTFKDEYATTDYPYQLRQYLNDNILVKFKISNHKLLIEQSRYQIDHLSPTTRPTTATRDTTRTTDTTAITDITELFKCAFFVL